MSIQFVYFDLGGVLLSFCHDQMCRQMAAVAGVEAAAVRRALFDGRGGASFQWRLERGDATREEAYKHFCQETGTEPSRERLYAAASDIFAPIEPTISLARALHAAGMRMGILSNTNAFDWGFVTGGRFPFVGELFPLAALSFEARAMKPEPEIYRYAAELAGVEPGAILFTDDREENVVGAREAGFDAVQFRDATQLRGELAGRGIDLA
ncbi:MAG: HAD family phosphatase [Pirellulales bacterium]|nr:HAD family phosphatase [Pirellulales bacterium]